MNRWRRWFRPRNQKLRRFKLYDLNGKLTCSWKNELWEQLLIEEYVESEDVVLEIGANIGRSSILINKILDNKKYHVCLEPVKDIFKVLLKNKRLHNCKFNAVCGTLSFDKLKIKSCDESSSISDQGEVTENFNLSELVNIINKDFTVIFADCEGCLPNILIEFPELFVNLKKVILETDRPDLCDYDSMYELLIKNGFVRKFNHRPFAWPISFEAWVKV